MAQAELDIYKERFTSSERQLKEAQDNLQETKTALTGKKKLVMGQIKGF